MIRGAEGTFHCRGVVHSAATPEGRCAGDVPGPHPHGHRMGPKGQDLRQELQPHRTRHFAFQRAVRPRYEMIWQSMAFLAIREAGAAD